jgi:hypothetical protein
LLSAVACRIISAKEQCESVVGNIADIESELRSSLEQLHTVDRVAFAAVCAERLLHASRVTMPADVGAVVERLWAELDGPLPFDIQSLVDRCDGALKPEDEGEWSVERALTDDAVSALIYALRCWKTGQAQEAVWASRRAIEALHYFIEDSEPDALTWTVAHQSLFDHPLVIAELDRQRRDLAELVSGTITRSALRARAREEASRFIPG